MTPANTPDKAAGELVSLAKDRFNKLTEAEERLLRAAPRSNWACGGSMSDISDPSNDPSKANEWGDERQVHANLIRWLCTDSTAAGLADPRGIRVLGVRIPDILDLSLAKVLLPISLFRCRLMGDVVLTSAELQGLYLNGSQTGRIEADGLTVKGGVFLRSGFFAEGEVRLLGARIGGNLDCSGGTISNPPQKGNPGSGIALNADGAVVSGNVFLRLGFVARGEVRLLGARIEGDLDCHQGSFQNPALRDVQTNGVAIRADGIYVRRGVILREGFKAAGGVYFPSAQIGSVLDCSAGRFCNPLHEALPQSGDALCLDRAVVGSGIFLRLGFVANGEVSMVRAQLGADLDCRGGAFCNAPQRNLPKSGDAIKADRIEVKGSVFLRERFKAQGEVRLLGAQISGNLDCTNGTLINPLQMGLAETTGRALSAEDIDVRGHVFLRLGFSAAGFVKLGGRVGGNLDCRGASFAVLDVEGARCSRFILLGLQGAGSVVISVENASTGELLDEEGSWPAQGRLRIDGFVYGRISQGPRDAKTRLKWLALQPRFAQQPYRQLAKVLHEEGNDRGAREVLYEMERCAHGELPPSRLEGLLSRGWSALGNRLLPIWIWVLKWTIGYGYYPSRALGWLVSLTLFGAVFFRLGYSHRYITPTEKSAYNSFKSQAVPPAYYLQFNSIVYSLENSVPLLKLGQDSRWMPDPAPLVSTHLPWWLTPPTLLRLLRLSQIVAGWILGTLFVVGITGAVRRD